LAQRREGTAKGLGGVVVGVVHVQHVDALETEAVGLRYGYIVYLLRRFSWQRGENHFIGFDPNSISPLEINDLTDFTNEISLPA
jgi:hypothetical protein